MSEDESIVEYFWPLEVLHVPSSSYKRRYKHKPNNLTGLENITYVSLTIEEQLYL